MMMSYWVAAAGAALATTPVGAEPRPLVADIGPAPVIDKQTITEEVPIGSDAGNRMTVAVSVGGRAVSGMTSARPFSVSSRACTGRQIGAPA